ASRVAMVEYVSDRIERYPATTANVTAIPHGDLPDLDASDNQRGDHATDTRHTSALVALFAAIVAAVPAVPVAVNVTGLPEREPEVAVNVFGPAVALRVQPPTVATPLALVV